MDEPSLIIHVYNGHGYQECRRVSMEKNVNAGGIQIPGYKATGLTVNPEVKDLLADVTIAAVRGDEQGFHVFVIPANLEHKVNVKECVRLCEEMAAFWGEGCDSPIWPGAYIIDEQEIPIRDLVRAAVGWRKP